MHDAPSMSRPPVIFALLALGILGCGAPEGSPGDATQSEFRAMQVAEERVDLHSMRALDPMFACDDACKPGREVCGGARTICGIAEQIEDADADSRCADARRRCRSAASIAASRCPSCEPLR